MKAVKVGHGAPGNDAVAAVLVAVAVFKALRCVALGQILHLGGRCAPVILMHEFEQRVAGQFAFIPVEQFFPGRIGRTNEAVKTGHDDEVGRQAPRPVAVARALLDARLQGDVELRQLGLCGFLLFDVGAGSQPLRRTVKLEGHGTRQVPAVNPVMAAQAELDFVEHFFLQGLLPALAHPGPVVRVQQLGPAAAQQCFFIKPGVVAHFLVDPVQLPISAGRPDMIGNGLSQHAKPRLALLKRRLDQLALGDVLHHAAHPDRHAGRIAHELGASREPAHLAGVGFFDTVLDVERRTGVLAAGVAGHRVARIGLVQRLQLGGHQPARDRKTKQAAKLGRGHDGIGLEIHQKRTNAASCLGQAQLVMNDAQVAFSLFACLPELIAQNALSAIADEAQHACDAPRGRMYGRKRQVKIRLAPLTRRANLQRALVHYKGLTGVSHRLQHRCQL